MKKTFKLMLAMFMALTMALGTTSTAYAAKPVDDGYRQLDTEQFIDQEGRQWILNSIDYKVYKTFVPDSDGYNYTAVTSISDGVSTTEFTYEDFSPSINWNRGTAGIATFKNSLMNLTISGTDPLGVAKYVESRDQKVLTYNGPALVKGTVTLNGVTYIINCTVAYIYYAELININK